MFNFSTFKNIFFISGLVFLFIFFLGHPVRTLLFYITSRLTQQAVVDDYLIPKNSHALANLWGFMKDSAVWSQPEEFRPERFLEGNRLIKHQQFVPFGIGKRACMGEKLARDNLFIFMTTLIKNIEFGTPVEHDQPDPSNFTDGFTMIPHPFYVNIRSRNNSADSK